MFIRPLYQLSQRGYHTSLVSKNLCSNQSSSRVFCTFNKNQHWLQEATPKQRKWVHEMNNVIFASKSSYSPKIEFKKLDEVNQTQLMELMNNPLVLRQMPLVKGEFDDAAYQAFISAKEQLWLQNGYGPWAFMIDEKFAGWGGLQFEQGDADLAMVLHPNYWGIGKFIYKQIVKYAFVDMRLESITVLLPPSRNCRKALLHFGFQTDGELQISGELFLRFRLFAQK